jgi:hypothetical protein
MKNQNYLVLVRRWRQGAAWHEVLGDFGSLAEAKRFANDANVRDIVSIFRAEQVWRSCDQ